MGEWKVVSISKKEGFELWNEVGRDEFYKRV